MSVQNFKPAIWSARLLANLDKKLVYGNFVNRDYEGEIKEKGDKVKINRIGPVTVKDFTGDDIDAAEKLTSEQVELAIDQAKYFNFKVDDVDAVQSNVALIDRGMDRAAYAIGDVIDNHIASFTKDSGIKIGSDSAPITVTPATAYDALVDLSVALNENNVDKAGRFAAVPPWYLGLLSKDPRFTKEYRILENGLVDGANVAGFTLYESNNVVKKAENYSILAGTEMGIAYAGQISKIEAYRPEKGFADAIKGLFVYGTKVIEPKALCEFVVGKPSGLGASFKAERSRTEEKNNEVSELVQLVKMLLTDKVSEETVKEIVVSDEVKEKKNKNK